MNINICLYIYHILLSDSLSLFTQVWCLCAHLCVCLCLFVYLYIYICIYMYIYTYTYTYAYVFLYVPWHIYICMFDDFMYITHILYKHFYHGFTVDFPLSFEFVCVCLCLCARVCVRARESVFSYHVSHFYLFFTLHILYSQHIFMYCLSLPISCALYILLPLGLRGIFVCESVFICETVSCFCVRVRCSIMTPCFFL